MTQQQRVALDARFRQPQPAVPPTLEELRDGFAGLMASLGVPSGFRADPTTLGPRPALHVQPEEGGRPGTLLYFHGGSYVMGSPTTALTLTANLVVRTGVSAFSVDYRLAPEHPYPAGPDDALAAYRALLDDGVDPATVVLAGDSAGGGLSVATCLAARRAGLPTPAAVVAFSAGLDLTRTGRSMTTKAALDPFFTREGFDQTAALYLAGQDPATELLSPATLADLTDFPPLLLQVGTNEMLLDDSTRLAARAVEAGVDVTLDVVAGVPHVFQAFTGLLDEAGQALDRAALFITQHLPAPGA
ncbi:alpha/beta hydrolase [Microlunatus spumicola]|uniref:Alpha/beta hydrolase n=1 Tax=Microlunatus spumicola TaxID=81499 RepID=A0ABP6X1I4_9ACTN